ncbi:MAG: hypothetical protein AUI15_37475 [Actinobacteria bacterium 13_2_20CM_2_66_6]|nr:MAG: hypothetical protein AUI15_37475 [Actinobacteria bacterium 13_2_20CM_2_66_6]
METAELEPVFEPTPMGARARRALALIAASVITIATTGALYLHPTLPLFGDALKAISPPQAPYRVASVDFVNPSTGWVVADFDSGNYAVLHTADGGVTWSRQLSGAGQNHARYLKFFDVAVGIFALVGTSPQMYRTADGGRTWSALQAPAVEGTVASWSFVDSEYGWMLVSAKSPITNPPTYLYRTDDGGVSWHKRGLPAPPDQAFQVNFSYLTTGWLTSANAGPYAYKTTDFGATWTRVQLPAPAGGWPHGGRFLVAVQPTSGGGAVASVVYFPAIKGRTGVGADIRAFPPLVVRSFDGGRPHTYTYTTLINQFVGGPLGQEPPPNQARLSTSDNGATWSAVAPPSSSGAIGSFDAANWWWIGAGQSATSGDGGATWTELRNIGAIEPLPGSLRVLDRNHAWYAGAAGARPLLEATADGGKGWRMVLLPAMPDSMP